MERFEHTIKMPTTGVFDFPSLILGGKGKYVDKTDLLYRLCSDADQQLFISGARPTCRSPALQRNEPNESEVPYVRLEISNRQVSRGQVCHDSGSQHGLYRLAWVDVRRAR